MSKSIAITGTFEFKSSYLTSRLLGSGARVLALGHNPAGVPVHLTGPESVWSSWEDVGTEVRNSVLLTARMIE